MRLTASTSLWLSLLALTDITSAARQPSNSVLLSKVSSLTLYAGKQTTHRRVSAIPQLKCVGGRGCGKYEIDVMRCTNQGSDYDDGNIQWTCTATLPEEFKLGSTDVICEGYDSPDDPYILKGSCGVEYRLALTKKGEEKFGSGGGLFDDYNGGTNWGGILFSIIFLSVLGWILYSAYKAYRDGPHGGQQPPRGGFGGGGGWGPGGNDDPFDDPPPPYPGSGSGKRWSSRNAPLPGQGQQQGWRPGFWSGALGGAAAGYLAGNRGNRQQQNNGWFGGNGSNTNYGGTSGSRSNSSRSSSNSSTGSARYESTGFGSTSRR